MRRLAFLVLVAGCDSGVALRVVPPAFGALTIPELSGEVVVSEGGDEVARAAVSIDGDEFSVRLPELPAGKPLEVVVIWRSSEVVVARSEPKAARVESGKSASLEVLASDYRYPDDDGDGATNLVEINYGAAAGVSAVDDSAQVPPGYFNDLTTLPASGWVFGMGFHSGTEELYVASVESDDLESFPAHRLDQIRFISRFSQTLTLGCTTDSVLNEITMLPGNRVAALCTKFGGSAATDKLYVVNGLVTPPEQLAQVAVPGGQVAFASLGGDRVYVVASERLYAVDPSLGEVVGTAIFEDLDPEPRLSGGVDRGDWLLLTDEAAGALLVVTSDDELEVVARPLAGELRGPTGIAVHPAGDRAYVANRTDGALSVINVESDNPDAWRVVATVPIGTAHSSVAIEPAFGSWVYASSDERFVRIDTLTNKVDWEIEPADDAIFSEVVLSDDGKFGAVQGLHDIELLRFSPTPTLEREPNASPSEVQAVLDAAGERRVGWAAPDDDGDFEATVQIPLDTGLFPYEDDFEDLYELGPGAERVAIAVVPGLNVVDMVVGLFDADGELIELGYHVGPIATPSYPGTGATLISPPLADHPGPLYVGVAVLDLTAAPSSYDLVVAPLPAVLPTVAEIEPNNGWAEAQRIAVLPMVVEGHADAAETSPIDNQRPPPNTDDFEDCYVQQPLGRRVGIRLDAVTTTTDFNLKLYDAAGLDLPNEYYWVGAPGLPEHFVIDPLFVLDDVMVCVGIRDSDAASAGDYRLTFVDLGL